MATSARAWTREEAPREWWTRLQDPDDYDIALDLIVRHYQGFVQGLAFRFKSTLPSYISDDDLLSYGQIGLLKAIARYNPEAGAFRKFASTYVHGAIVDELRSQDWAPRNLRKDQQSIRKAKTNLQVAGEEVSVADLADHLGWDAARLESTVQKVQNSHHQTLDGVELILDSHTDPESMTQTEILCGVFVDTLETFSPLIQYVMASVYFEGASLTMVSAKTNVPLATIRQIHSDALALIFDRVESAAVMV